MPHLRDDRYDAELQAETASFAAAVRDADPARPVPTCPAWTLAQLTAHVGFGHRWAAVIVERRATGPVPNDQADDLQVPEDAEERSRWLLAGARRLADAVREPVRGPAYGAGPRTRRRGSGCAGSPTTLLVHRLDAELAVGRAVAVTPDLAAERRDLLDLFRVLPRIDDFLALAGLRGHGQTLHFHATDPDLGAAGEWLARRPRPASSGSTGTTRATSPSAARPWTCCWC